MPDLKTNERSEAIELIKESQKIFDNRDLVFKQATGEQSLKRSGGHDQRANTLFPDILYYEDELQTKVALGWELKMPDTDINDKELFSNAVDKADRLKTNAFVLWNFKQVVVYYRSNEGSWMTSKRWDDLKDNTTRQDVIRNRNSWKALLLEVIVHLNELFREKIVSVVPVLSSAETIAEDIANKYSAELAQYYKELGNRPLLIEIKRWYETELLEFSSKLVEDVSEQEMTRMFAKNILINWVNRIIFSNLLKSQHNSIYNALGFLLDESSNFNQIAEAFNEATKSSDFYSILHCDPTSEILSDSSQSVLREYASFLNEKQFDDLDQKEFQTTLESIVDVSKRELMGLYTTPKLLAKFLVKSSIKSTDSKVIDPCVGSGTIISTTMNLIAKSKGDRFAHDNIWASDKYRMPMQVANISMSSKESLNLPNIIFQKDLLSLRSGQKINITDPIDGKVLEKTVPEFDYVISNLPFIRSERIKNDQEEKVCMAEVNEYLKNRGLGPLDLKKDWYQFGIVGIERILKDNGSMSVITSNSWLKTKGRKNFIELLFSLFEIDKVIISGKGRWFDNADVVTTILVLNKKMSTNNQVKFVKLNVDINHISEESLTDLADSMLINDDKGENYTSISYSKEEIVNFIENGLSLNVLFHNMKWFEKIQHLIIPMTSVFSGRRGIKSTNDRFFYDIDPSEKIEPKYIKPLLKTPASVKGFTALADSNVFLIRDNFKDLAQNSEGGAYHYIKKFEKQPKTKSQLELEQWYQLPDPVYGDFVTSLNPDQRLFWSSIPNDLLINQRLTVFRVKQEVNADKRLIHALLNTYFGQFMIEATGFGRGLGVLDTTKEGIMDSVMLDFNKLNADDALEIVQLWEIISDEPVPNILDQLSDKKWLDYNKKVFEKFGVTEVLDELVETFKQAVMLRNSVRVE
ncbi:N-6 DNA methylase [Enterococcus faecalis]|uniref:N-6 DNA methylase n=1 Tax=Enterococcus faecalis TaxID=1351 RepID=UPI002E355A40|nr:N-6 DNA methylase [Enterococcus faecalis]MED7681230.1 N-6 DNA methylase [Enterococcus faecalis]MED7687626.1 N-6 DNA methylase [Enterococcus faecalis]MED7690995.1 N-6 DNA methylase [Enterococcus faecalis]MED7711240.1 N-6 DNA methylase [Enterococcus faecalis]MED7722599.1 N-6 DNA methylase [Enterococcus faecalis]